MGLVAASRMLVAGKLRVPSAPARLVARPRVEGLIAALIEGYPAVFVIATAGAGKTTALVQATGLVDRPLAWVTVSDGDVAAGRLLEYLEAAISARIPAADGPARAALAAGVRHDEAAGLLAEAVGEQRLLLVLDEVERIARSPSSLAVIEALVRYAPAGMRVALASRRELPLDIAAMRLDGRAGIVDEHDLALTEGEAAQALRLLESDADPREAVEATGGWIAGVMFEAWREGDGAGGRRADPLHGYLARNMVDQLSPEERELLLATSVFREVTAQRAAALGITGAAGRLSVLRARHLPATWGADPLTMRCHPRFREYLLERFEQVEPERATAARLEYARLMQRWAHPEEAVEAFLSAGALEEGASVADTCVVSIVERLDFAVAKRWLEAFASVRQPGSPGFVTAELMICAWTDDNERGARLGDRLKEFGERERLAESSPLIAALLAWCYGATGIAPGDARRMLQIAPPGAPIEAIRYTLTLADDELADPDARPPSLTGGPLDVGLLRAHYHRGELELLAEEPPIGWEVAIEPWRILALGALGQTGRALERYQRSNPAKGAMWMAGLDLMIDLGRYQDARALLELAPKRTRSDPLEHRSRILEARIALRAAGDTRTARRALTRVLDDAQASSLPFLREHAETWLGFADLLEGRDAHALARLRATVARMQRSGLRLLLPAAAVYLAEAEWRAGQEEASDRAADVALGAAEFQGSYHRLLQALADFPAVAWRRADATASADSPWHRFARILRGPFAAGDAAVAPAGRVQIAEFGEPHIVVDGDQIRPKLTKALSLLAWLGTEPGHELPRPRAIHGLFESGSGESTESYLRMAIRSAREVLPPEVEIVLDRHRVCCRPQGALACESVEFEALLAAADRMAAAGRLDTLKQALAIPRRGVYLEGDTSPWANDRRGQLEELVEAALLDGSAVAYELGAYRDAERLVRDGLARNPFRESGWRLLMRVAAATHDGDGVIEAFRGAERALSELGTTPSRATVALLGELRH